MATKRVGKYEMGKTLGEGTFGKVKHAINVETHEAVAIKVLDKEKIQSQNMGNQIKREISIMKVVKHKYVVEMIEVLASKTKIFIVLELVTGGELFGKIVSQGKFTEEQALFYFLQLVEGVEYCHKLGVCHRDLKPENLLLDSYGNLKISDFGLSSLYVGDAESDGVSRTEVLHTTCGTPNYVAPEVLADQGYDGKKADVWSIGVILYVMLAGFLPFDEPTIVKLFAKIQKADFTYPSWFSTNIREVLVQMLVPDPKVRIGLSQLKDIPWLKSYADSSSGTKAAASTQSGPSEVDLVAAVQSLSTAAPAVDESVAEHDESDEWDAPGAALKTLNAFDLITQCGGFCLERLFSPHTYCAIQEGPIADNLSDEISGNLRFDIKTTDTKFNVSSSLADARQLAALAFQVLTEVGCDVQCTVEEAMARGAMRATKVTPKGKLGIGMRVFNVCSQWSLLEVRRGSGPLLEWNQLFSLIVDVKMKDVLFRPAAAGEAKESS